MLRVCLTVPSHTLPCCTLLYQLFAEAGLLYEHSDSPEHAVAMYTKTKNWDKVGQLLPLVSATRYHGLYAKAKEADGQYQEAAKAYKMAQDYDNFVR